MPAPWSDELMVAISLIVMGFLVVFLLNLRAEKKD
jgi:heme/copper-type cytochrome/quinol oxidase subunit 2